jgi:hypothetical protein
MMNFDDLDLDSISAADFLAALEESELGDDEEVEKTASEIAAGLTEDDLNGLSAEDLMFLLEAVEDEEAYYEKTAALQSGDYDGYALAGDVLGTSMASAFAREMEKVADDDDEDDDGLYDISDLSAGELMELVDSGEYELVEYGDDGFEKEAMPAWLQSATNATKRAWGSAKGEASLLRRNPKAAIGYTAAKESRKITKDERLLRRRGWRKQSGPETERQGYARTARGKLRGIAAKRMAAYGSASAAGVGGAGYGGYKLNKKRKAR